MHVAAHGSMWRMQRPGSVLASGLFSWGERGSSRLVLGHHMNIHQINFQGALLQRGFWLYVWRVNQELREALYVGRTGDSSSRFAASPFSRLGQHLDLRPKATANMLLRNLKKSGFDPVQCSYSLFAFGPLYPEQPTLPEHRRIRDLVAPIESALAKQLAADGHQVIGNHPKASRPESVLYDQALEHFRAALKSKVR